VTFCIGDAYLSLSLGGMIPVPRNLAVGPPFVIMITTLFAVISGTGCAHTSRIIRIVRPAITAIRPLLRLPSDLLNCAAANCIRAL